MRMVNKAFEPRPAVSSAQLLRVLRAERPFLVDFGIVRAVLALLLTATAFLKAGNLIIDPSERWINFSLVIAELAIALILFFHPSNRVAWFVAASCFGVFSVVAGWKWLTGERDCGCFGTVAAPPIVALAVDVAALLSLIWVQRPTFRLWDVQNSEPFSRAIRAFGTAVILVTLSKAVWTLTSNPPDQHIADPLQWKNRSLPFLASIDVGDRLEKGDWIVVFHRPGCEACEEVIKGVLTGGSLFNSKRDASLALLSVTGTGTPINTDHSSIVTGNLISSEGRWLSTPLVVHLHDGLVKDVMLDEGLTHLTLKSEE